MNRRCFFDAVVATILVARQIQKEREMEKSEKDRLATRVVDLRCSFQPALTKSKRKYPVQQSFSFASAVRQYTELIRRDRLVRRDVAVVMNGLLQSLELERKRVPGEILYGRTAWSPCSLLDMIRTLRETSLQVCRREDFRRLHHI